MAHNLFQHSWLHVWLSCSHWEYKHTTQRDSGNWSQETISPMQASSTSSLKICERNTWKEKQHVSLRCSNYIYPSCEQRFPNSKHILAQIVFLPLEDCVSSGEFHLIHILFIDTSSITTSPLSSSVRALYSLGGQEIHIAFKHWLFLWSTLSEDV